MTELLLFFAVILLLEISQNIKSINENILELMREIDKNKIKYEGT